MIPACYAPSEYSFLVDEGAVLRLIFTSEALNAQAQVEPTTPLWFREAGDKRSLEALIRWVRFRRSDWPAWGKMALEQGQPALAKMLAELLEQDPPYEAFGVLLQTADDKRELTLGELGSGRGLAAKVFFTHRFASEELCDAFRNWLLTSNLEGNGAALLEIALNHGTDVVGERMNAIAREELLVLAA